ELLTIFGSQSYCRLNPVLPSSVHEQALLRREAEIAIFQFAVLQHAEFLEQFADVNCLRAWNRNIVRGPRIGSDFVLAPTGIAPGLIVHFEENEILESSLIQSPGCAESGDASADNDDRNFQLLLGRRKAGTIA